MPSSPLKISTWECVEDVRAELGFDLMDELAAMVQNTENYWISENIAKKDKQTVNVEHDFSKGQSNKQAEWVSEHESTRSGGFNEHQLSANSRTVEKRGRPAKGTKYPCSYCLKLFKFESALMIHLQKHTGEKPFQCEICKKRFTRKGSLQRHARIHSGEKPFKCKKCSKAFTQKNNRVRHVRTCNGLLSKSSGSNTILKTNASEQLIKCSLCSQTFLFPYNLIRHSRSHAKVKPYKCFQCTKTFASKYSLTRHFQKHNVKPKECSQCSKTFSTNFALLRHFRTHTGAKRATPAASVHGSR